MNINVILSRLEKVTRTGDGQYQARCPAHNDRNPSLSIREAEDGRVLVTCHAGCSVEEVVNAVGLRVRDLFPESQLSPVKLGEYRKRKTHEEILQALRHEMLVLLQVINVRVSVGIYSTNPGQLKQCPEYQTLDPRPWERELLAVKRIKKAVRFLYG